MGGRKKIHRGKNAKFVLKEEMFARRVGYGGMWSYCRKPRHKRACLELNVWTLKPDSAWV